MPTNVETDHPRAPASAGVFTRPLFSWCCSHSLPSNADGPARISGPAERRAARGRADRSLSKVCPIRSPRPLRTPLAGSGSVASGDRAPEPPHRSGKLEDKHDRSTLHDSPGRPRPRRNGRPRQRALCLGARVAPLATGTRSLAAVLAKDGAGFDRNWNDFDIVDNAVTAVLTAKPGSAVGVLADGKVALTAFLPTDRAFRNLASDLTGKHYTVRVGRLRRRRLAGHRHGRGRAALPRGPRGHGHLPPGPALRRCEPHHGVRWHREGGRHLALLRLAGGCRPRPTATRTSCGPTSTRATPRSPTGSPRCCVRSTSERVRPTQPTTQPRHPGAAAVLPCHPPCRGQPPKSCVQ